MALRSLFLGVTGLVMFFNSAFATEITVLNTTGQPISVTYRADKCSKVSRSMPHSQKIDCDDGTFRLSADNEGKYPSISYTYPKATFYPDVRVLVNGHSLHSPTLADGYVVTAAIDDAQNYVLYYKKRNEINCHRYPESHVERLMCDGLAKRVTVVNATDRPIEKMAYAAEGCDQSMWVGKEKVENACESTTLRSGLDYLAGDDDPQYHYTTYVFPADRPNKNAVKIHLVSDYPYRDINLSAEGLQDNDVVIAFYRPDARGYFLKTENKSKVDCSKKTDSADSNLPIQAIICRGMKKK